MNIVTPLGISTYISLAGNDCSESTACLAPAIQLLMPATSANHIMNAEFPLCAIALMDSEFSVHCSQIGRHIRPE